MKKCSYKDNQLCRTRGNQGTPTRTADNDEKETGGIPQF